MKNSNIEWTDHTFNPWEGCTKVSPGCLNCYAETRNQRFSGGKNWGKGAPRRRTSASNWKQPLKWNRDGGVCVECGTPRLRRPDAVDCECGQVGAIGKTRRPRVFCASLADWLDDEVPIEWLADLLKLIHDTPNLDWLLLTKRPENWHVRIAKALDEIGRREGFPKTGNPSAFGDAMVEWLSGRTPPQNVWIGTSVEDQTRADERIPALLKIPARIRFLSCEPLLQAVNLQQSSQVGAVEFSKNAHWVICGGESGADARPFHVDWATDIIQQCRAANVAPFLKQLGSNIVGGEMDKWVTRIKDKKGGNMDEWPQELRVREFPTLSPGEMTASGGSVHPTHTVTLDRSPGE